MKRFAALASGLLLFCLPQALISFFAIRSYAAAGIFSAFAVGTHVAWILAVHLVFFAAWAIVARRRGRAERPGWHLLYAGTCALKALALNGVYLSSYTCYRLWNTYLSWDNLRMAGPHLRGFYLSFGKNLVGGLALAFLLSCIYFGLTVRLAGPSLRRLGTLLAARTAPTYAFILATFALLVAANLWLRDPLWTQMADRDPILAFWTNRAAAEPVLTPEMLAEHAAGQAYAPPAAFARRNVLVFVVDCLRNDHLSFRGYTRETTPFLSSLYRAGRLQAVDFAVSNGNDSPQGIRSILNSRPPHRQSMHNFRLQDVLKRAGYRIHIFGTGDHTTLDNMRAHYGPNVDVFHDGLSAANASVNDDRGLLEAIEVLSPAGREPCFFYIHLMSVHELGIRDPAFLRWQPATTTLDWGIVMQRKDDPQLATNTYDDGILQADDFLRRIFAGLESKGYLRDYVAVITGDHGQGLGERGHYGHTRFLFSEDVDIPMFFLESGAADYGPMPFGSQVDIAPTLLARLGLPQPLNWTGRSLYRSAPPETAFAVSRRGAGWRAVYSRRDARLFKYLFSGATRVAFQECLYDVKQDLREMRDLAADPAYGQILLELRLMAAKEFSCSVPPVD